MRMMKKKENLLRERRLLLLFDDKVNAFIFLANDSCAFLPVTEQTECVGHAVRAVYLYCAIAE